ncbi:MAG: hypothetical protein RLY16_628 [Bacteroidota bacterium]|jgi:hypothetical protein
MAVNAQIPFNQILTVVKTLTPAQKELLKAQLEIADTSTSVSFTNLLMNGPVYTENQIKKIEENRKRIAAWRTKK